MSTDLDQPSDAAPYDAIVIGGAFSGAAAALLLRRARPEARILIVERRPQFDRKVGEATVEISAYFLHQVLGLYDHLSREHLPKHGLRYWFTDRPDRRLDEMTEVGGAELPLLASFQLDRARLDEHLLACAAAEGCELLRPARIDEVTLGWPESQVTITIGSEQRTVRARWLVDGSGREGFLATKTRQRRFVDALPTAALWARWRKVADLDAIGSGGVADGLPQVAPARRLATNHFCGYGWWCWVIPLRGGETSVGLVYDKRLVDPGLGRDGPRAAYQRFLMAQPGLRDLLASAEMDAKDFSLRRQLAYTVDRYMAKGWALVGDAASFIDPFYSPGLDHASISIYATTRLILADLRGELSEDQLAEAIETHNTEFATSIGRWIAGLYVDKYEIMGDAELMRCSFLVDTALYYLGVVGPIYADRASLGHPIFGQALPQAAAAAAFMRFFRGRLVKQARFRLQTGMYGRRNVGWRPLGKAYGLGARSLGLLLKGLGIWVALELGYLRHRLTAGAIDVSRPVIDTETAPAAKA